MFGFFKKDESAEPGHRVRSGVVNSPSYPDLQFAMEVPDDEDGSKTTILQTKDGSLATARDVPGVGRVVSLDLTDEDGRHTPLASAQPGDRQSVIDQCREFDRRLR